MAHNRTISLDFNTEDTLLQVVPRSPVLSSYKAGWNNICVECHRQPPYEMPSISHAQHVVAIFHPQQPFTAERTLDGRLRSEQVMDGDILVVPAEASHSSSWNGELEATLLILDPAYIANIIPDSIEPDRVDFVPHFAQSDPLLYGIGLTLKKELESGSFHSNLYVDSLCNALSMHLLYNYASREPKIKQYEGGLSRGQLNRTLEYINDHLEREIKLNDLAKLIGMSQYYFSRLFKQSMGIAPYEYVIQQRVERAKQLLKQRDVTILDVATQCGFTHSSHLARHFKRIVGVAPQIFQKH
ncbi:MAG: AraC family transcriptional regulator [Hydrococcus sp. Prado102]|jgi:AraC family transcriptional regulator|nr:AraC family transcriptional regulator [Hydrococcus sp. Prado102]